MLSAVDGVVVLAAAYGAWVARRMAMEGFLPTFDVVGSSHPNWPEFWRAWVREPMGLLLVPLTLMAMWTFGLYKARRDRGLLAEAGQIFRASLAALVAVIVMVWAVGPSVVAGWDESIWSVRWGIRLDAGRVQLGVLGVVLPALLMAERAVFRLVLRWLRRRGWNLRHVAVVGTGRLGRIACRTLDRNSWTGIHVAYFVSHMDNAQRAGAAGAGHCVGRPILGGLAELEQVLERNKPDAVYLALPANKMAILPDVLRRLERFALEVRIIPDVNPRYMPQNMVISELEGMPILSVRENPMNGGGGMVKRGIDIAGAVVGLLIFGVPMLLIAAAVRATSRGPVIFKQRRVSLGGETFNIYKFRTMYHAEDEQANRRIAAAGGNALGWTARNDPRVTSIGAWLRKTSLDELPQFLNVLRGDMSLVGPRPERPELIERFRDDWRGYMLRQHVKAGLTGWAQVNGLRGDTSLRKRLQFDLFYIRNWSLAFDVKILWLTLFRGFVHRNAH